MQTKMIFKDVLEAQKTEKKLKGKKGADKEKKALKVTRIPKSLHP